MLRDASNSDQGWSCRYEIPGQGWVKKLFKRNTIPEAERKLIVDTLNKNRSNWFVSAGLTSIFHSDAANEYPEAIIEIIMDADKEA